MRAPHSFQAIKDSRLSSHRWRKEVIDRKLLLWSDHLSLIYILIIPSVHVQTIQVKRSRRNQSLRKLAIGNLNHIESFSTLRPFKSINLTVILWLQVRIVVIFFVKYILTKVFIRVGSLFLWFPMHYYLIGHLRKHGDLRLVQNAVSPVALINWWTMTKVGRHWEPYVVGNHSIGSKAHNVGISEGWYAMLLPNLMWLIKVL